jgi:Tol biopolymer transport system component/DNA-binding winged helix-turn-helix (wHTH) protein
MARHMLFRFDRFELRPDERLLLRDIEVLRVPDRAFSVLVKLVESAGDVVDKRRLLDDVWADTVVTEDNLVQAVGEIRAVLGDSPREPRFVQTVHRRGYRFVCPVRTEGDNGAASDPGAGVPSGGVATASSPLVRRVVPWLVGAATVLVLVMVGWGIVHRPSLGGSPAHPAAFERLGGQPAGAVKPACAPRGELVAVVAPEGETGLHALYLVRPGVEAPLQLTHGIDVRGASPAFTPDGSAIYFASFRQDPALGAVPDVWQVPLFGGTPRRVLEGASAVGPAPDGGRLAYAAVLPDGTEVRVREVDGREHTVAAGGFWPRWSPDGAWIAYTTSNPEGGDGFLDVVRPDGGEHRRLTASPSQLYGLAWSPDSRWVLYSSDSNGAFNVWAVPVTGGDPVQVTFGPGVYVTPEMTPDGSCILFVAAQGASTLVLSARPGERPVPVLLEEGIEAAAISPSGDTLALALGGRGRDPSLCVVKLGTRTRQVVARWRVQRVRWTPDGRQLLVSAPPPGGGPTWIWLSFLDGQLPRALLRDEGVWDWPDLSADGRVLAAVRRTGSGAEVVVVELPSGRPRVLARETVVEGLRLAPDGQWVAWDGGERPIGEASGGIWVVATAGGVPRRLAADGIRPLWSADGQRLVFARHHTWAGLWDVEVAGGQPRLLRAAEPDVRDLRLEDLDIARTSGAVLATYVHGTSAVYVLKGFSLP